MLQIIGSDAAEHLADIDMTIGDARATGFVTRGLQQYVTNQ